MKKLSVLFTSLFIVSTIFITFSATKSNGIGTGAWSNFYADGYGVSCNGDNLTLVAPNGTW